MTFLYKSKPCRSRQKFSNAGLLLIGSGSLERDLGKRIQPALAEHILLPGDLPHAATLRQSAAQLMLRTTLYDGDALSVREALQLGTPVIATDNGMRPAGVDLIPRFDLPPLLQAIEQQLITQSPARRQPASR